MLEKSNQQNPLIRTITTEGKVLKNFVLCCNRFLFGMYTIKGYENRYSIDKEGNVFSHKHGKFLKTYLVYSKASGLKYRGVKLVDDNGKVKSHRIYRLLAETFIPNPENLPIVDHRDRDTSNNILANLRWCTYSQNSQNRIKQNRNATSKYKGVSWDKWSKKWAAYATRNRKSINLGRYDSEEKAAEVYNEYVKTLHGQFALLNIL